MRDGWRETTLGEVLSLDYGKALKESDRDGAGWPVYGSAGVVGRHSLPLVPEGSVIVVGRKGTAGVVHWSEDPCWPIDTTYFVRPLLPTIPRFLFLLLQKLDLPKICAQTGVPGLNRDRAYELPILLPPLDEQRRIVDLIAAVDEAIEAVRAVGSNCASTYSSLLSKMNRTAAPTQPGLVSLRSALLADLLSGDHEIPASYDALLSA